MTFPRIIAAVCALCATRSLAQDMGDRVSVKLRSSALELSWEDTEDRLRGMITPVYPRAGRPIHVVLDVGSYDGKPFQGPVTMQLRKGGATYGPAVTVANDRGTGWKSDFTPDEQGHYSLDMSFRTTHLKVLHAAFEVAEPGVPPWALTAIGAIALLCAAGYGVFRLVRAIRPAPPGQPTGGAV